MRHLRSNDLNIALLSSIERIQDFRGLLDIDVRDKTKPQLQEIVFVEIGIAILAKDQAFGVYFKLDFRRLKFRISVVHLHQFP